MTATYICPPIVMPVESERALMRTPEADVLAGRSIFTLDGPRDLDAMIMHRAFCRDGRRVYEIAPDAQAQLEALPARWPDLLDREAFACVLRTAQPTVSQGCAMWGWYVTLGPIHDGALVQDGDDIRAPEGVNPEAFVALRVGMDREGNAVIDEFSTIMFDPEIVERAPKRDAGRLLLNAVAAILDQRVSQVIAHPRHGREGREYQRRGISVSSLRLSADGLHTWRTRLIGDPDGDLSGRAHTPPAAHLVHAHTARYWMDLDAHPDLVPERDDEGRWISRRAPNGRPLFAVRLPRAEHVRGSGAATPRVTRVRSDRP